MPIQPAEVWERLSPKLKAQILDDMSSTKVRKAVGEGRPIKCMVAPAVERVINEGGLYVDG